MNDVLTYKKEGHHQGTVERAYMKLRVARGLRCTKCRPRPPKAFWVAKWQD